MTTVVVTEAPESNRLGEYMAGLITHLVIANEILKIIPEGLIKDTGLFFMGNIAPDAVHARENYIRVYKKHSHFRDDIPDKAFEEPDNYMLYCSRLADFINRCISRADGLMDLYRGYVVHIITDELFVLSVRKEFCETMKKLGIEQDNRLFFEYIVNDMRRNDMLLLEGYKEMTEIRAAIEKADAYAIEDYISRQELQDSRQWLIRHHFIDRHELIMPEYISHERTTAFIDMAAKEIAGRLSGGSRLPRML
ncbi:MAG: zinc dependent phospholipase C family protein [Clostridiales bacterium]|nr:zinc dependent phospholipase C family protein [Clostridiales bacterium]